MRLVIGLLLRGSLFQVLLQQRLIFDGQIMLAAPRYRHSSREIGGFRMRGQYFLLDESQR